jgi:hypothetical protein
LTENPRVGSSILSLGTKKSSTYDIFVSAFLFKWGANTGTIHIGCKINPKISYQILIETGEL